MITTDGLDDAWDVWINRRKVGVRYNVLLVTPDAPSNVWVVR
jgi:hypothetical protein